MSETIKLDQITIPESQRELDYSRVQRIADKIESRGYNSSYPITLDGNNTLVDGGHRLEAAKITGLDSLPYVLKPEGVSPIRHAIFCNEDGADTRPYDVFDYAELCYNLAEAGWKGQQIADELGWGSEARVTYHSNIKAKLHPIAWQLTRFPPLVNGKTDDVVNQELTIVNWSESHFRAMFTHVGLNGTLDRAIMRAQLRTIRAALANPKKITAKWIDKEAQKHAWHAQLSKYANDTLVEGVTYPDWRNLIKSVRDGVFGNKPDDDNLAKFQSAVSAINEQILGVRLFHDNAFQRIPTLDDKSVALVATDPPYNVTANEWDQIGDDADYIEFTEAWLNALRPKLADDYHLFFCVSPEYQARVEQLLVDKGWPLKSRVVWSHRNLSEGRDVSDKFITMWEMVFHCGTHALNWPPDWNDERFEVQEWAAPQSNFEDKKLHPTSKPLGLFELFVKVGSKPGDVVLDCFAGGGTTGEACKNIEQRQCILIERDNDYCHVIEQRLGIKRTDDTSRNPAD